MNFLINLHVYLMVNVAIAIGFIITRFILSLSLFEQKILQKDRLLFARCSFFIAIMAFFLMPTIVNIIPSAYHSNFQLEPILKTASVSFLQHHHIVNEQVNLMRPAKLSFSLNRSLIFIFLFFFVFVFTKYIYHLFILNKIRRNSFCRHNINKVHLLFSHSTNIPFCYSLFNHHFIVIPSAFLEKINDLKLALRHELQHIRQRDTYWLHFLMLIKAVCFWNPFIMQWIKWLDELQEFSCDESIVLRRKTPVAAYAQCLINAASDALKCGWLPQGALGMQGPSQSILYRRVNMLFNYKKSKMKKLSLISVYIISSAAVLSTAYALNSSSTMAPLSTQAVTAIIQQSDLDKSFQVAATTEVVDEINHIRSSDQARLFMRQALQRMKQYQPTIQEALTKAALPKDLLVVPLVESGYQPLDQSKNPVHAAGIWQFIPDTAKHFGLVINEKRDDRLDTSLATKAALAYLKATHEQFNDWGLAVVAYEIGENATQQLIKETGSRDVWVLARASGNADLNKFVAMLDAELIIMHNPSLITKI